MGTIFLIALYFILASAISKIKILTEKKITPTLNITKNTTTPMQKTYTVKEGDYLWKIAEEIYGSGFNAYDIANANNIQNPNLINPGQNLILPTITPKSPTRGEIFTLYSQKRTIAENKYIVKEGDYLWKIALQAYGDGYAWVKIASFNKLTNPNLIHPGNILILP